MNRASVLLEATWQGAFTVSLCAVSLVLPLDVFYSFNSLLLDLHPLEIIRVYGAAWFTYLVLGAITGALTGLVGASILMFIRLYSLKSFRFLMLWIIAITMSAVLVKGFRTCIGVPALDVLVTSLRWGFSLNRAIILGLSIWFMFQQRTLLLHVPSFLKAIALCGAFAASLTSFAAVRDAMASKRLSSHRAAHANQPPIILITIDTLAANHMSLYGYARQTTPALDRFGTQAIVFDAHHSNSNFTTASISSILSGERPWVHRALRVTAQPLPQIAERGLLSEAHRAGYRTLAVTTNFWASPAHQGASQWVSQQVLGSNLTELQLLQLFPKCGQAVYLRLITRLNNVAEKFADASNVFFNPETAFKAARELLSKRDGNARPFLWVHLLPPHNPYAAPAPFLGTFEPSSRARRRSDSSPPYWFDASGRSDFPGVYLGRYDESVLYVDHHVGRFLDWLRQEDYFNEALIIVTADHGESFSHDYGGHAGPLLHEDLIHVPLLIKLPHQTQGRRVTMLTEHADLLPTMLDYFGETAAARVEGRSLKPILDGRTLEPQPAYAMNFEQNGIYSPLERGSVAMLDERYKYVHYFGEIQYPFMPKLEDALCDLATDPGENRSLINEMPDRATRMRGAIEAQVGSHSLPVQ